MSELLGIFVKWKQHKHNVITYFHDLRNSVCHQPCMLSYTFTVETIVDIIESVDSLYENAIGMP